MKSLQTRLMALGMLTSIGFGSVGIAVAQEGSDDSQTTPATSISQPAQPFMGRRAQGPNMERHAQRMEFLKKSLRLTAAQEPAWDTFAQAFQPPAGFARGGGWNGQPCMLNTPQPSADSAPMTTPERIAMHQRMQAQMVQHMNTRNEAVLAFYSQLDDAQKATFDQEMQARARPPRRGPMR